MYFFFQSVRFVTKLTKNDRSDSLLENFYLHFRRWGEKDRAYSWGSFIQAQMCPIVPLKQKQRTKNKNKNRKKEKNPGYRNTDDQHRKGEEEEQKKKRTNELKTKCLL